MRILIRLSLFLIHLSKNDKIYIFVPKKNLETTFGIERDRYVRVSEVSDIYDSRSNRFLIDKTCYKIHTNCY